MLAIILLLSSFIAAKCNCNQIKDKLSCANDQIDKLKGLIEWNMIGCTTSVFETLEQHLTTLKEELSSIETLLDCVEEDCKAKLGVFLFIFQEIKINTEDKRLINIIEGYNSAAIRMQNCAGLFNERHNVTKLCYAGSKSALYN